MYDVWLLNRASERFSEFKHILKLMLFSFFKNSKNIFPYFKIITDKIISVSWAGCAADRERIQDARLGGQA